MNYTFRAAARLELIEAFQWYLADGGPVVAEEFEWAVQRALDLLQFMPQIGRPTLQGVRTWGLKRFPYTLVYRVQGKRITVIALAHQSRDPSYWVGRLPR